MPRRRSGRAVQELTLFGMSGSDPSTPDSREGPEPATPRRPLVPSEAPASPVGRQAHRLPYTDQVRDAGLAGGPRMALAIESVVAVGRMRVRVRRPTVHIVELACLLRMSVDDARGFARDAGIVDVGHTRLEEFDPVEVAGALERHVDAGSAEPLALVVMAGVLEGAIGVDRSRVLAGERPRLEDLFARLIAVQQDRLRSLGAVLA